MENHKELFCVSGDKRCTTVHLGWPYEFAQYDFVSCQLLLKFMNKFNFLNCAIKFLTIHKEPRKKTSIDWVSNFSM